MKITCNYCKGKFDDTKAVCPYCGAANPGVVRTASDQPVTVDQLKAWYSAKGLPPYEVTRFFIGEDHKGPKAFGIYKDAETGNFVVYKNKSDGSRSVRYEGTDEAYAVNELYMRLKQEIIQQRAAQAGKTAALGSGGYFKNLKQALKIFGCVFGGLVAVMILIVTLTQILGSGAGAQGSSGSASAHSSPKPTTEQGYYTVDDQVYYHAASAYDYGWFEWDDTSSDWKTATEIPGEIINPDTAGDFYSVDTWDSSTQTSDFEDSQAYKDFTENQNTYSSSDRNNSSSKNSSWGWDSDDDSSYNWDSGSDWDSDFSGWDSDW